MFIIKSTISLLYIDFILCINLITSQIDETVFNLVINKFLNTMNRQ